MKNFLKRAYTRHKDFWEKDNFFLVLGGFSFLILAIILKYVSDKYVDSAISTPVGDLILNNIPTFNVDDFVILGTLAFILLIFILFLTRPKTWSFSLKAFSLFIIIRAFFVSLTHLGTNLHQVIMDTNAFGYGFYNFLFYSKTDFFFSGHTGIPFLLALIFYKEKKLRYFFFACSFVFGTTMLLGHLHYSIDVFAAPFITYTIFIIAKKLFKKDYELFL
jgi:hypothetical protein